MRILKDDEVWPEMQRLAARKRRGAAYVVVPYLTKALLDLREGDTLVCELSDHTLAMGQTDPKVLRKYLRAGVAIHRSPGLHAKLYILGNDVVVLGSANMSKSSETDLREAVIVARDKQHVAAARDVARALTGLAVDAAALTEAERKYRKPKGGAPAPRRPSDKHPAGPPPTAADRLWVVALSTEEWPATATKRAIKERRRIRRSAGPVAAVELEGVLYDQPAPAFKVNDYIINAWTDEKSGQLTEASHPAQIVELIDIAGPGKSKGWTLVYSRRPAGTITRPWNDVRSAVRQGGGRLGKGSDLVRLMTSPAVRHEVLQLWQ